MLGRLAEKRWLDVTLVATLVLVVGFGVVAVWHRVSPLLAAHHKVFAEANSFNNDIGEPCPMALYVRDGSAFVAYGLSGGP